MKKYLVCIYLRRVDLVYSVDKRRLSLIYHTKRQCVTLGTTFLFDLGLRCFLFLGYLSARVCPHGSVIRQVRWESPTVVWSIKDNKICDIFYCIRGFLYFFVRGYSVGKCVLKAQSFIF